MELEAQDAEFERLFECPEGCGRTFKRNALEKHIKICKKVFQKKDEKTTAAKRGSSVAQISRGPPGKASEARSSSTQKWKEESQNFRQMLRGGKGQKKNEPGYGEDDEDLPNHTCDICKGKFNEGAYKRHRPLCESKKKYMEGAGRRRAL